tara:strand:- start:349 stop:780 length:432 start_codon:yes stop_codon:yes gene_type:complete
MSMVVGLDDLVRLAPLSRHDANRILDSNLRNVGVRQSHEEVDTLLLPTIGALGCEPPRATYSKVRAWWEGNEQVPPVVEDVQDGALVVASVFWVMGSNPGERVIGPVGFVSRQQVTGHGLMTLSNEGIANGATVFAGYEHSHR